MGRVSEKQTDNMASFTQVQQLRNVYKHSKIDEVKREADSYILRMSIHNREGSN